MRTLSAFLLASALCAAGCGGGNDTITQNCTLTLSGAVTATATCTAVAAYSSSNAQLGFAIAVQGTPTGFQSFAFALQIPGNSLAATTYTTANSTKAGTSVLGTGSMTWAEFFNEGVADQGSFSATISSTGSEIDSGSDKAWAAPHGTFTATLAAVTGTGATGTVNASATF